MSRKCLVGFGIVVLLLLSVASAQVVYIEPDKTSVSPGETFNVDISVSDGSASSVLVNFTFDNTLITYVDGSTYDVFDFTDTLKSADNYVSYLGVSTSPVDISSKTKVATVTFSVNSGATGTITFNVVMANIDGNDVSNVSVGSVTIVSAPTTVTTPPPGAENIIKFDYGAVVKVEVISVPEPGEDTIVQVISESTGETVSPPDLKVSGTGSLDITGLEPGNYYLKVINAGNTLDTSDPTTWDKKSVGTDFVEIGDGNFDVKIKGASDVEWVNDEAPLIIQIKTAIPKIDIELKNPMKPPAIGDMLVFKVRVSGVAGTFNVKYSFSGPYDDSSLPGAITPGTTDTLTSGEWKEVKIDTTKLVGVSAGMYSFTVKVMSGTDIIAKKSIDVELKRPEVTVDMPSSVVLFRSISLKGTSNVAETGSEYDAGGSNMIIIYAFTPDGTLIKYNSATGEYELSPYKRTDINVETNDDLNKVTKTIDIQSGGEWKLMKSIPAEFDTGSYEIDVIVTTDLSKISDPNFRSRSTNYVIVTKPKISIELPYLVYAPGQSIIIKGTTNLDSGHKVVIEFPEDLLVYDVVSKTPVPSPIEVYTDENGNWETPKYYINPDAEYKSYTIKVHLEEYPSAIDVVSIYVRKVTVEAELGMTKLTRSSEVTLTGKAPTDTVFLFTDEKDIFENVGKMPATEKGDLSTLPPEQQPMVIRTSEGEFTVTLTVTDIARDGSYILYVVASPDGRSFDLSTDPYTLISVTILPIGIVKKPDEIKIVRGTEYRVFIEVNGEPEKDVFACYTLEGKGVKVTKGAIPSTGGVSFTNNNGFTKWNETEEGTWFMFVDLYPYYDIEEGMLTSSWDCEVKDTVKLLPAGTYDFTIHIYTKDPDSGIFTETSSAPIVLEIEPIVIDVNVNRTVVRGEDLRVEIKENRVVTTSYDHIYVILDTGTKLRKFSRVPLDPNGTAVVEIPTADLKEGKYYLYVRDTMGTECGRNISEPPRIEDYYKIPPTDSYALHYAADDDALVGPIEIEIVAPGVVTPTPTTPAPTTPTPTTPPPTTPPTTVVTTPPPTTTTPSPGFEAIFAIAGLIAIAYLLRRRH